MIRTLIARLPALALLLVTGVGACVDSTPTSDTPAVLQGPLDLCYFGASVTG